ncbi:hypothetical protein Syun_015476 [Stephania yunnanensis]|uniref:Neuroguidin n=1 Tax=Stephania yunnanensis TaxID=152371 RepID=A0AAP0JL90_9MAGN
MVEAAESAAHNETFIKDAPRLAALLKEMKDGLDLVRSKVVSLTEKVRENKFPTVDGISYLEAKHLLLISYCQSIVYYLLRKAKGLSIEGHPVVRSLVEIRLFLEKIRPIDKKLEYQIQKLVRGAGNAMEDAASDEKKARASKNTEDPLKYRPNPDMLEKSTEAEKDGDAIYRPPKFAPTTMEEDKMSKQEKQALRKEKDSFQKAKQSAYLRELRDELEGRPEEVRETFGTESRELTRYMAKMEEQAKQEEEHFIRAPITKAAKMREKHLKKSRNGLLALTDGFYDETKGLPLGDENKSDFNHVPRGGKKFNKHKRKH